MTYRQKYDTFYFEKYSFDSESGCATFEYSFDRKKLYVERVYFTKDSSADNDLLQRALKLSFILAGISYYKAYPTKTIAFRRSEDELNMTQATFFTEVYRDGLSQFVYENNLTPNDIASFPYSEKEESVMHHESLEHGTPIVLQSGGKDSLLLAQLLENRNTTYIPWYVRQTANSPSVLETLASPLARIYREIDRDALASSSDSLNGHVPITFIMLGYATIDAVLQGTRTVISAVGREGEEPYAYIGEYAIRHQWAKTWHAEQLFQEYVTSNVSSELRIGSPLRGFSELHIAELFVEHCWERFGRSFSSCNVANYKQGHDNTTLSWCGNCAKCANSYLLFAPFIAKSDLDQIIGPMFENESMVFTFKGLLSIDDVKKPFECIGETDELRYAYRRALQNGYPELPFDVADVVYDYKHISAHQAWAYEMIQ